jgi:hypothetical protein
LAYPIDWRMVGVVGNAALVLIPRLSHTRLPITVFFPLIGWAVLSMPIRFVALQGSCPYGANGNGAEFAGTAASPAS